ncbi:MAG: hypothetical protein ACI3ZS_01885 [Candidatus Cryptobacteroides sp.]
MNEIVSLEGKDNVIIVSIHANAFGNSKESTTPSGWSVYTSKGQTKDDGLAERRYYVRFPTSETNAQSIYNCSLT